EALVNIHLTKAEVITSFIIAAIGELLYEIEAARENIIQSNKSYLLAKRKYPELSNELED
ncbi:MAG: hypothetical protein GY757_46645, partial [bacterium]|nr:hypothetical protein [bacterium]